MISLAIYGLDVIILKIDELIFQTYHRWHLNEYLTKQ